MTEFERRVLEDLSMLKTQMLSLLGNGQPGRLHHLETSVSRHDRVLQRLAGAGVLFGFVLTLIHFAIDVMHKR